MRSFAAAHRLALGIAAIVLASLIAFVLLYFEPQALLIDHRVDDYVELGELKGNIGDQNYLIPADVDVTHFQSAVIWCKRFSVAFGAAALG